jgi:hypothetical protein
MKKLIFCATALLTLASAATLHANGPIAAGDLLVFQVGTSTIAASSTASPLIIDEINPSLTSQTVPVQFWDISTMSNPLYSDNQGSVGDMTLSDGGTEVSFSGWTATNGASAENLVGGRGAGVLTANGSYTLASTYAGSTTAGNTTRSAYSPDGVNWYFGDKGGVYTQNSSSPLTSSSSTLSIRGYAGTTYSMEAISGTNDVGTITPSTPNGASFAYGGLTGLPVDKNAVDFALVASGHSGAGVYDTLYTEGDPSGVSNYIEKFTLSGGAWSLTGSTSFAKADNLAQLNAEEVGGGDVDLFVSGDPSSSNAYVDEFQDNSGYGGTLALTGSTTIYTAPTGVDLQGVTFAPVAVPEPASLGAIGLGAVLLLAGSRRIRAAFRKA